MTMINFPERTKRRAQVAKISVTANTVEMDVEICVVGSGENHQKTKVFLNLEAFWGTDEQVNTAVARVLHEALKKEECLNRIPLFTGFEVSL